MPPPKNVLFNARSFFSKKTLAAKDASNAANAASTPTSRRSFKPGPGLVSWIAGSKRVGGLPGRSKMLTRNWRMIIEFCKAMRTTCSSVRSRYLGGPSLMVIGGARYESEYSKKVLAESHGRVRCVGPIYQAARLTGLFENCYTYFHGHEVGGTNPSLLRAMHAGAACVPLDVVFNREVMSEEGEYFSKDAGDLARIIRELDTDPARVAALGRLGQERAVNLYRWDAVVAAYDELFRKTAQARRERLPCRKLLSHDVYRPVEFAPS